MSTAIKIIAQIDGTDQVNAGLRSMGANATDLQRRINAATGVSGRANTGGLLSAQGAAAQMQARLDNDLLRERGLQLEKMRGGFRIAADEGGRFGGRMAEISNHTAMLGGRLLGIDPMLVRLGGRFGVFGLAAAAGLGVLDKSIEAVRSNLEALELKDPGKLGTLWNILTNSPFERDTEAVLNRRGAESDARLGAFERGLKEPDWFAEWKQSVRDFEVAAGEKLTPDALRQSYDLAKLRAEEEDTAARAEEQRAKNTLWRSRSLQFDMQRSQKAEADRAEEMKKKLRQSEKDLERGQMLESENRQATLRPWMDEAKNPKGFAETTLSNSLEGVKAVAEAATAGERRDATLSAMQDQIRLLQDIRTNTGNANQTVTVGAL